MSSNHATDPDQARHQAAPPADAHENRASPPGMRSLPIASLVAGRKLPFNLYNHDGLLLLARGTVITPRFLNLLKQQQLQSVNVPAEALDELLHKPEQVDREVGEVLLETDTSRKADESLDSIHTAADTTGEAVQQRFEPRKAVSYEKDFLNDVMRMKEESIAEIDTMLDEVVDGATVTAQPIEEITGDFIVRMSKDLDATVSQSTLMQSRDAVSQQSLELSVLGMALAAEMGFDRLETQLVGVAGMIHDMGMLKVPEELVKAPRRLSRVDFLEIAKHPIYTLDMTERVKGLPFRSRMGAYQTHERCDGSGYPRGRTATGIDIIGKVLAVADAYLGYITKRSYRPAFLPYHAMEAVIHQAHKGRLDAAVTRGLLRLLSLFPLGSFVMLTDGRAAKVIRSNPDHYDLPVVEITHDANGDEVASGQIVNLAEEDSELRVERIVPPL